jgi:Ser/Thr protein kinase RdoA (MazF antagonist)
MAPTVLQHYQLAGLANITPLGNRGGFSGARLWRVESLAGPLCLRAWPERMSLNVLLTIHQLMDRARRAGLPFVPNVWRTTHGQTVVESENRLWDLTAWMAGAAEFHRQASDVRIANACRALAHLHRAWADARPLTGPCPGVLRRLERIRQWQRLVDSGWRPDFNRRETAPWHFWAQRAWPIVQSRLPELPARLAAWLEVSFPLQACLCDIWHDHVLYTGADVSGVIDYGSVKTDNVAVDLARLLGSLVGDDRRMRTVGLEAYAQIAPLSRSTSQLVDLLDESGTILAAANWLTWLYHDGRCYAHGEGVAGRLASLVQRMEGVA